MCVHYCVQQSQTGVLYYDPLLVVVCFVLLVFLFPWSAKEKERKYIIPSIFIVTIREKERESHPADVIDVWNSHGNPNYIYQHFCLSLFLSLYNTHIHIDMRGVNMFVRVCVLCIWSGEPKGSRHSHKILLSNGWNRCWTDGWVLFYFIFLLLIFRVNITHTPDERAENKIEYMYRREVERSESFFFFFFQYISVRDKFWFYFKE